MKLRRHPGGRRRGAVGVLILFMIVVLLGFVSLAIDLGYLCVARTELQRSADSAALAAAWELIDDHMLAGDYTMTTAMADGRAQASTYASYNRICTEQPALEASAGNSSDGDVVFGTLWDFHNPNESMSFTNPANYNAVRVRVRRTPQMNGSVPVFFAGIWGQSGCPVQGEATAATLKNIGGFKAPAAGGNIGILPFALDIDTWNAVLAQSTSDDWSWDPTTKTSTPGHDGIHECNLFPQGTGCPGNRGTVDIGSPNNSTADIARQITDGITPSDFSYLGGTLQLNSDGELPLNGDTGISAGVKDELASITGEPKIIPIFSQVQGPGNNAQYTIVMFVGVRVLDVKLTGSARSKRLIIQPANVITSGAIAGPPQETTSYFVYTRPMLVR